jgi:hypothetical protein
MNNQRFGKLDAYEKAYTLWFAAGYLLLLVLGLLGHWPPLSWVWIFVLIGFGLVGESEHKKIMDLNGKVQKLEERLDILEKRPETFS